MKRKELEDMGLTKEQIDSIMRINGTDIENAKAGSAAEITGLQTEVSGLTAQVKERDNQLKTLEESTGDAEAMKQQIATLQADNTKAKETYEAEMKELKTNSAIEKALGDTVHDSGVVIGMLDKSKLIVQTDGTVTGLDDQVKGLKESKAFLFKPAGKKMKGAVPGESEDGDTLDETKNEAVVFAKGLAKNTQTETTNKATEYYFS